MNASADILVDMLREIETADPIDFGDLPFGEQGCGVLLCTHCSNGITSLNALAWASRTFMR
jgi:hypothetical protein